MKKFTFWTFTADASAFGHRQREFFEHLKEVRAVSETMRMMKEAGYIWRWYCVQEFHESGMIHFHLIIEPAKRSGYIPQHLMQQFWNRERNRPSWAGEPGVYGPEYESAGQQRHQVGGVRFEKIEGENPVVRYVCGYLSGPLKKEIPRWFIEYLDEGHNGVFYSCSRGDNAFWPTESKHHSEPEHEKRQRRLARLLRTGIRGKRTRKRKTVKERHTGCRTETSIMCRRETITDDGEVISTAYEYLGRISAEVSYNGANGFNALVLRTAKSSEDAIAKFDTSGVWITPEQLEEVVGEYSPQIKYSRVLKPPDS